MKRRTGMRLATGLLVASVVGWFWLCRNRPEPAPLPKPMPVARDTKGNDPRVTPPDTPPKITAGGPDAKVALLRQILESRNDNDPRLDTDFRHLDAPTKRALIAYYRQLPKDDANGRGTVVFLLGREIEQPEDLAFFDEVLDEKIPKAPPEVDGSLPMELLAAYPQVMAVSALNTTRQRTRSEDVKRRTEAQLKVASENPNAQVSRRARRALASSR